MLLSVKKITSQNDDHIFLDRTEEHLIGEKSSERSKKIQVPPSDGLRSKLIKSSDKNSNKSLVSLLI
jgi:hypothetical protein